ncbi:unnamed protein product [Cutaneotrichosporon oleaginosum]
MGRARPPASLQASPDYQKSRNKIDTRAWTIKARHMKDKDAKEAQKHRAIRVARAVLCREGTRQSPTANPPIRQSHPVSCPRRFILAPLFYCP